MDVRKILEENPSSLDISAYSVRPAEYLIFLSSPDDHLLINQKEQ